MFREIRRKDRVLSSEEARDYLVKQEVGVLSVLGDEDYPYGVPVNFAVDAIQKHPKVCFTVLGNTEVLPAELSTNYTSVIVFGMAEVVPFSKIEERQAAFEAIAFKYSPKDENTTRHIEANREMTNVIRVRVEHLSGKRRGPAPKA